MRISDIARQIEEEARIEADYFDNEDMDTLRFENGEDFDIGIQFGEAA